MNNKYLNYTEVDSEGDLSTKEQLRLIAQKRLDGKGGYIVWRRQGGAGGSYPLGLYSTRERAEEVKETIEAIAEGVGDKTGYYTVEGI